MAELLPNRDIDLRSQGGLLFREADHTYENDKGEIYTGMSTFIKQYAKPFDGEATARYKAIKEVLPTGIFTKLKKKVGGWQNVHKYYDLLREKNPNLKDKLHETKEGFFADWAQSTLEGSIEHDRREKEVLENGVTWNGKFYPPLNKNILEITKDDVGVVPEIMVWNHETKLCGLADLPIFDAGVVHMLDYKTNKEITMKGFMGATMTGPFNGIPDCSLGKYSGQLHGYLKMACDLTGFERGECIIIHTANEKYKRKEDKYIPCLDLSSHIDDAFDAHVFKL